MKIGQQVVRDAALDAQEDAREERGAWLGENLQDHGVRAPLEAKQERIEPVGLIASMGT